MKDNLKTPCNECPFRIDSAPGYLGGISPEATLTTVINEGDFACHKTRHKKLSNMSRCRGSLLFLRQACKLPRYNIPLKEALAKFDFRGITGILLQKDFINHHS